MSSRALTQSALVLIAILCSLINLNDSWPLEETLDLNHVPGDANEDGAETYQNESLVLDAVILTKPLSRSYKCFLKYNANCSVFRNNYTAGALVGRPDFVTQGPKDGRIASCNIPFYDVIDEHKIGRWNYTRLDIKRHNGTHYVTNLEWTFNKRIVPVEKVRIFLTDHRYTDDQMLQRAYFHLVCSNPANTTLRSQNYVLSFACYVHKDMIEVSPNKPRNSTIALTTVEILDSGYAFYQVADVSLVNTLYGITGRHGYVSEPRSRALLCKYRRNKNCGQIVYEPQSVEGYKGFPYAPNSPPDGRIASGNLPSFYELDEYGEDRWYKVEFPQVECHNRTHVSFNVTWVFTTPHSTEDFRVYMSNENFDPNQPLSRKQLDLNPLCLDNFHGKQPEFVFTSRCPVSLEKYKELSARKNLLMLNIWNIGNTKMAFYQVVDLQPLMGNLTYENVAKRCVKSAQVLY